MKIFILLTTFIIIVNCSFNKVVKKHGVRNLEEKQKKLEVNISNKNDIKNSLGPPSVTSKFDNDLWIYIEREITKKTLFKLGKEEIITNNVLIVEIDNRGTLIKKDFYDISNMNEYEFTKGSTDQKFTKKSFVYDFLSSMRQKINDPLGKRKKP